MSGETDKRKLEEQWNRSNRSNSLHSTDTFVLQEESDGDDDNEHDGTLSSQTYISPTSSTSYSDKEAQKKKSSSVQKRSHFAVSGLHSNVSSSQFQDATISRQKSDGAATTESDGIPVQSTQPAYPFFSSYDHDSDVSDGSMFKKLQQQLPQHKQSLRKDRRDRFPSFDSLGSSGSVRYISPRSQASKLHPSLSQGQIPVNSHLLPYHERRKLMLQRQKQKQSQQHKNVAVSAPVVVSSQPMVSSYSAMPEIPPPQFSGELDIYNQAASVQDYPVHPYAPMPMGYPAHPSQLGTYFPQAICSLQPPPRHKNMQTRPPAVALRPRATLQLPNHSNLSTPPPPAISSVPRPPPGRFTDYHPNEASSSSVDSFEAQNDVHRNTSQRSQIKISNRSVPPPPPPPPPPLPPPPPQHQVRPPVHVRQDSNGSVSSLGSLDKSGREDERSDFDQKLKSTRLGLLQRLNPWSTPVPTLPTIADFHRKNQEFLSKVDRSTVASSPIVLRKPASPMRSAFRLPPVSKDKPPPSHGTQEHLSLIEHDDWTEKEDVFRRYEKGSNFIYKPRIKGRDEEVSSEAMSSRSSMSSSESYDVSDEEPFIFDRNDGEADELTRLLPPSGISSNEYYDRTNKEASRGYVQRHTGSSRRSDRTKQNRAVGSVDMERSEQTNITSASLSEQQLQFEREARKRKKNKYKQSKHRLRRIRDSRLAGQNSNDFSDSSSKSSREYRRRMNRRVKHLEEERARLIEKWKKEARAEEEAAKRKAENGQNFHHIFNDIKIGAVALSITNLGVVWFKFMETNNPDTCQPVHFHSSQCTFPEFPGCFYCDTNARLYRLALHFHWTCSAIGGILAFSFVFKLLLARQVVFDELNSPTTASPAGLICMTMDIVFAGRGLIGMFVVSAASFVHLCLAFWFIYMALAYRIMPEPSWFPNTVGIGISAVKTWLYHPTAGHFLMAISLSLNFFFFPISLIRVALNKKISATVGWMQMSAPNISLYVLTIMAQPSFEEEHPDVTDFQRVHRMVYLPCMHFLFALCIVGMIASCTSLLLRWREFRMLPFSPAHAAFCNPTLSHANAIQSYLAAVNSFSTLPPHSLYMRALYYYWIFFLGAGTVITVVVATKFIGNLPKWTHFDDMASEIEPPAPYETSMTSSNLIATGETLLQPYVSPAVLQANETGALVFTRDDNGHQQYRRTRRVTALGFEPIMDIVSMERERDILLEWVGTNSPRRRHRTLSVPGIDFSYGAQVGTGSGVYGFSPSYSVPTQKRPWLTTLSPQAEVKGSEWARRGG